MGSTKESAMHKDTTMSNDFNEMLSDWAANPNADPYIRAIAAETLAAYFKRINATQPYIDAVELAAACWKQVAKLGAEECTFEKLFVEQLVMFADAQHPASMDKAIASALEICGGTAERYAKENLTKNGSVQTGVLRNSITHQPRDQYTMEVGTSVGYAPYVELGHHQEPGRFVPAIKNSVVSTSRH